MKGVSTGLGTGVCTDGATYTCYKIHHHRWVSLGTEAKGFEWSDLKIRWVITCSLVSSEVLITRQPYFTFPHVSLRLGIRNMIVRRLSVLWNSLEDAREIGNQVERSQQWENKSRHTAAEVSIESNR